MSVYPPGTTNLEKALTEALRAAEAERDRLTGNIASDKLFIKNLLTERDRLGNELAQERAKPGGSYDEAHVAQIQEERDRLAERLADWESTHRAIMDEPCGDERHCTCVPSLRADNTRLRKTLMRIEDESADNIARAIARAALAGDDTPPRDPGRHTSWTGAA